LRLPGGVKRPRAGTAAAAAEGDKQEVMSATRRRINTKLIESVEVDSRMLQQTREEIQRMVGLVAERPGGETLRGILTATSVPDLKKLVEIAMTTNNDLKFRDLKKLCFPNFHPVMKFMIEMVNVLEEGMTETARYLTVDAFMSDTGLISWKEMHTFCQDTISAKERAVGAAQANAMAP
jgi:hypothetical protein